MAEAKLEKMWEPHAAMMSLFANANSKRGNYKPSDFMPKKAGPVRKARPGEFKKFAERIIKSYGGKVEE